jgi:hypothetical protein
LRKRRHADTFFLLTFGTEQRASPPWKPGSLSRKEAETEAKLVKLNVMADLLEEEALAARERRAVQQEWAPDRPRRKQKPTPVLFAKQKVTRLQATRPRKEFLCELRSRPDYGPVLATMTGALNDELHNGVMRRVGAGIGIPRIDNRLFAF